MGWFLGITFLLVIAIVIIASIPPKLKVSANRLTIGRIFPKHILIKKIKSVEFKNGLPGELGRRWGHDSGDIKKGSFYSELGPVELSIYLEYPPFLYIKTDKDFRVINNPDTELTRKLFERLQETFTNKC
ncbi:hypothetical protein [Ekhidna sp.]|uniref:hypothetical protein n=1 Tax=Ekhidna sp. TaxID=2608089 RepID=UPI003BACAECA